MAIHDYRYDPFNNVFNIKAIYNEEHQIPTNSPYTIRLNEVPQKTEPTTMQVKFKNSGALTEVSAIPAQGQYWPDYLTIEHGDADWNTGTLLFNAADAGKTVQVTYNGLGALVDDRLLNQVEIDVTSSTQPDREANVPNVNSYDSVVGSGNIISGRIRTHKGLAAGTYSLQRILQHLVNLSHTQEYVQVRTQCDCNCNCDCSDDAGGGG